MTEPDTQADQDAVRAVVAAVERAQRDEDVAGFVALFHPDAVWTTGAGVFLDGRDEIEAFTRKTLPGATANGYATYEVFFIRFFRHDVAVVKVRQRYWSNDGVLQSEGSPMYGMTKNDEDPWLLTFCQNTPVVAH
ncbi:SgcJ/EcaC family oxidoreductase [Rhodococcus sp. HNM0569]|uniref:SgcJ/EcaC family oxidoreductase n=1 Tax=Rhodococcus sp. HNM0569 TaxID=2716340 RepID=UPI00146BCCDB|nr:SgcJ/EcaC family oxidoreductase [Rhodococcus sp. HNM0569]NLU84849.1 SgcJ/EcaC family oxidoreductase [Rhodococcus sp. HNM0569]